MTGWLVVVVMLGQEEPLTPPPPPPSVQPADEVRVPLNAQPGEEPVEQPADLPPPVPPEEQPPDALDESPPMGFRVSAAAGLGLVAAGVLTVAMHFVGNCRATNPSDCVLAGMGALALGAGGIIAGAIGGHRLFGGKSNLGWAFLGMGAGSAIGFVGFFIVAGLTRSTSSIPTWAPVISSAAVAAIGAAFMLEVGHALMVKELKLGVAPVAYRDGAGLSVGGTF